MNAPLSRFFRQTRVMTWLITAAVLATAFLLGQRSSLFWLGVLAAGIGGAVLLARPVLVLPALVVAALLLPIQFGTGTEVKLNLVTFLVPAAAGLWLLYMLRRRDVRLPRSRTNLPMFFFLAAGLLSLGVGTVTWNPLVPRPANFTLVQLAQLSIFAFSALAFWLTASLIDDETWLWRLTAVFLAVGGGLAVARLVPVISRLTDRFATLALDRAPFWALLAGLAGGQLLYNRKLTLPWRLFLLAALIGVVAYAFIRQRESISNWVGVAMVTATLVWLRFRRLRWPLLALIVGLTAIGVLFPVVFNFAGGQQEWYLSGGSRMALIDRVVEVTMRNPVTGLGPAAYRPYTRMTPLSYGHAYWMDPEVNSHNNYVDLFSHTGILGLGFFIWFVVEVHRLDLRLRKRYIGGFAAGYVNGMLAAGAGALAIMMLADWILPFVYNIGFPGFQASVLVWLFLGGLVALENMKDPKIQRHGDGETR